MLQAISITVREGFEAALVIGIMLSYAVKTGRDGLRRPILWGTAAAIGASVLVGVLLDAAGAWAENHNLEGALYLVAAVFVLTMVGWMWRAGRNVQRKVTGGMDRAATRTQGAGLDVAAVAFVMVAREGFELVLFLAANVLDQGLAPTLAGAAIGLAIAAALGVAVYLGAARIDMRVFFAATSIALLLLVSRFLGLGILELGEGGTIALSPAAQDGLKLLEAGPLATVLSLAIVGLPLGAVAWSLFSSRGRVGT